MKFADYFKEALEYGESLGLRNGSHEAYADFAVELDESKLVRSKDGTTFYPAFMVAYMGSGLFVENIGSTLTISPEQQMNLIKMFVSAYEKYLADKKRAGGYRLRQIEKYSTRLF